MIMGLHMTRSIAVIFSLPALALTQSFTSNAEAALSVLNQWYDQSTGLWDTTGWWNSANCITVLADLAAVDGNVMSTVTPIFSNTFTQAQAQAVNVAKFIDASGLIQSVNSSGITNTLNQRRRKSLFPRANNGFLNNYYDDEGWWALGWIAAFDLTQDADYLNIAISIFNDVSTKSSIK